MENFHLHCHPVQIQAQVFTKVIAYLLEHFGTMLNILQELIQNTGTVRMTTEIQ